MKRSPILLLLSIGAALALFALPAHSQTAKTPLSAYVGANGVFFAKATPWNADVEPTVGAVISASPHLSAVGSVDWGLTHSYLRGTAGARITATDVENPNMSVGLGIQYHAATVGVLRPDQWCPDVSIGVRPWPVRWPALTLTGLAWYGLKDQSAGATIGIRYRVEVGQL